MTSSSSSKSSEDGEPSSYERMEQALSVAVGNPAPIGASAAGISALGIASDTSKSDSSMDAASTKSDLRTTSAAAISSQAPSPITHNEAEPAVSTQSNLNGKSESFSSSQIELKSAVTSANDLAESSKAIPQSHPLIAKPMENVNPGVDSGPPKVVHASTFPTKTQGATAVSVQLAAGTASAAITSGAGIPVPIQPALSSERIHAVAPSERSTKPKGGALRRGKWTVRQVGPTRAMACGFAGIGIVKIASLMFPCFFVFFFQVEEEEYTSRVIQDFNSGFLNAPAGTTLRSYLSDKLQCDPMRITKKFTGESCIGKRVFHPAVRSPANAAAIDKAQVSNVNFPFHRDVCIPDIDFLQLFSKCYPFYRVQAELDALEKRWRRRLEIQQRESAKKAAASAAIAANGANRVSSTMVQGVPVAVLGGSAQGVNARQLQQTAVTQAASWLDRANAILRGTMTTEANLKSSPHGSASSSPQPKDENTQSSGDDSLENQMKEVQRLIYEGPVIQQTAAGLPGLLLQTSASSEQLGNSSAMAAAQSTAETSTGPMSPDLEPADKRMKTSATTSATSGAEDAEALIGFLSSVRASAAAGQEL